MVTNARNYTNKKIAILIENDVEDVEFQVPYNAFKQAGIQVVVVGSRMNEKYTGKRGQLSIQADATATETTAEEFDAVVIPGGMAPDKMRRNPNMVKLVKEAMQQGKLVAAVCHGPQLLIEADVLKGKQATGFTAIRKDMVNAGTHYIDEPLIIDGNLITSRQPGDLAIFTTAILSRLGYGGREAALPQESDRNAEWWKLADAWGGSSKRDIVRGLNTALGGERYSLEALDKYHQKESDPELKSLFEQMMGNKQSHIQMLENRLAALGEKPSITTNIASQYAKVKTALSGNDDIYQLRCALGDVQTGIGDVSNLTAMFTDPDSTSIFQQIYQDLLACEHRLVELYHMRVGKVTDPTQPTTGAAMSM